MHAEKETTQRGNSSFKNIRTYIYIYIYFFLHFLKSETELNITIVEFISNLKERYHNVNLG